MKLSNHEKIIGVWLAFLTVCVLIVMQTDKYDIELFIANLVVALTIIIVDFILDLWG